MDIEDDGAALRAEAPHGLAAGPPGGAVSVPDRRRSSAPSAPSRWISRLRLTVSPAFVAAVLQQLALFIGPAVAAQRARLSERTRLVDENSRLRGRLHGRHDLTSIIGKSDAMRQVCELVSRAAHTGTPVLLEGEAGTGKEFLARTLHHSSPWARKPFVEYSCSRMSGSSLETISSTCSAAARRRRNARRSPTAAPCFSTTSTSSRPPPRVS